MLINCPFVLSLLYFYWTCRQTPPLAGRKKKLPAVHIEDKPFSSVAVQIIGFSFQWLKGKIENTFWFGSPPKGECSFSSLIFFHKRSMRRSGLRLFTAFHNLKKIRKKKRKSKLGHFSNQNQHLKEQEKKFHFLNVKMEPCSSSQDSLFQLKLIT